MWKAEYKILLWMFGLFVFLYMMPLGDDNFDQAILESLLLLQWYAREHVLLCLVPAFFIAGVITVFVGQASVLKYFGSQAKKWLSYLVAAVSGSVLAVCSCTVLPLFAGIYKRGAGLGPATTFLYSGPAINVMAIVLTAQVLGWELGIARVAGAIVFSLVIGLLMHFLYRRDEQSRNETPLHTPAEEETLAAGHIATLFFVLVAILIFATWSQPERIEGLWFFIFKLKWIFVGLLGLILALILIIALKIKTFPVLISVTLVILVMRLFPAYPVLSFSMGIVALSVLLSKGSEIAKEWMSETWWFTKQIMPLLAIGILFAGFFLGTPGGDGGIIPAAWIQFMVGGNSLEANFFASLAGALMYFATLTEIPILLGLLEAGMGKGPALALLLSGPALSLPNMLVIRSVIGTQKTVVFVSLVIIMSTITGLIFGALF